MAKSGETTAADVPRFTAHRNENWKFTPRGNGDLHVENTTKPDVLGFRGLGGVQFVVHAATARTLLDGLAHACEHVDGAPAPADPELDPILDAIRERRFALARTLLDELEAPPMLAACMFAVALFDRDGREANYMGYVRQNVSADRLDNVTVYFPVCTAGVVGCTHAITEFALLHDGREVVRSNVEPTLSISAFCTPVLRIELEGEILTAIRAMVPRA